MIELCGQRRQVGSRWLRCLNDFNTDRSNCLLIAINEIFIPINGSFLAPYGVIVNRLVFTAGCYCWRPWSNFFLLLRSAGDTIGFVLWGKGIMRVDTSRCPKSSLYEGNTLEQTAPSDLESYHCVLLWFHQWLNYRFWITFDLSWIKPVYFGLNFWT